MPALRTSVRIRYDDRALYFFVRAFDPARTAWCGRLSRRDTDDPTADQILLFLDPFHDGRTGYEFDVTAGGVKLGCDAVRRRDGGLLVGWRVGGGDAARLAGMDGGVRDPVPATALPRAARAGVRVVRRTVGGAQWGADERAAVQSRAGRADLAGGRARRAARSGVVAGARGDAVLAGARAQPDVGRRAQHAAGDAAVARRGREVGAAAERERRCDAQPGLRPGGGRSGRREPERRGDLPGGAAALLRRGGRAARLPARHRRLGAAVLLAAHRATTVAARRLRRERLADGDDDPRRGESDGAADTDDDGRRALGADGKRRGARARDVAGTVRARAACERRGASPAARLPRRTERRRG